MKTTLRGIFCAIGRDTQLYSSSSTARFALRAGSNATHTRYSVVLCILQYNREFDRDERGGSELTIDDYVDFTEEEEEKMESKRLKGRT